MAFRSDKFDLRSLAILVGLALAGVVAIASATQGKSPSLWTGPAARQFLYLLAGIAIYFLVQQLDYHTWADFWVPLYLGGLGTLVLLLVLARPIAGTRAWFELGPLRFQPSELMKALTALAVAAFLAEAGGTLSLRQLLKLGGLVAAPMALIVLQPDMGTALTFFPLFLVLAWIAGMRTRLLAVMFAAALLAAPVVWMEVLKPYQKERILNVFQPERDPAGTGYQVIQSKIAVGSGRVVGTGIFQGSQSRLDFLPARETDFVLGVVAEETGFVGVSVVLSLFLVLILRALETAKQARDQLGTYLATGVAAIWSGQVFINTGMVTGVLPTIGVPLPVLSYGGSSMLATFFAFGLVASVRSGRIVNQ
jgi:rod shape determining protein RodA